MERIEQRIVLASGSSARQEALRMLGFDIDIQLPDVDEHPLLNERPVDVVRRLAEAKAEIVAQRFPNRCILAADTVVDVDGEIIGKPRDAGHAVEILQRLSGRSHEVHTAVCIYIGGKKTNIVDTTRVEFVHISEPRIQRYVATGEPMGKAGAYAAQGIGSMFIRRIEGNWFTLRGLPIDRVVSLLEEHGFEPMGPHGL